jgi:hypothetical protein
MLALQIAAGIFLGVIALCAAARVGGEMNERKRRGQWPF